MSPVWSLAAGLLGAFFAGIGIALVIIDRWYRITVEFSDEIYVTMMPEIPDEPWGPSIPNPSVQDKISLAVLVKNGSKQRVRLIKWRLSGPHLREAPGMEIGIDVPIDEGREAHLIVAPDWANWHQSVVSSGIRNPSFRASVIIDRRTRIYPRISRTARVSVSVETIVKNAAIPSQNS